MRFATAAIAGFGMLITSASISSAGDQPCLHCQSCPAHECVKTCETKPIKKVVYEVRCVPVCEHRPAKFLDCECCPVCDLKYKRVLIKREVVVGETCLTKCLPVELPCNCSK